jgi:hypothetical protein
LLKIEIQVGFPVLGNPRTHSDLTQNERKSMSNHSSLFNKRAEMNCQMGSIPKERKPKKLGTLTPLGPIGAS